MIEFNEVTRSYAQKIAVNRLSLTIPTGQLFALLGPNGAGKTTTIKMLTGLLRPSAGTVSVCGHDVATDVRAATQLLGYVPEEPFLYDKLSGREFLQFVAEMHGLKPAETKENIAAESAYFELDSFLDDLTETYSHGMRQRLIFASALVHRPAVLIVDEPMIGLDPRSARAVKDRLRTLTSQGTTVFMSTHTLAVAEEIADRIGIMDHGHLHFLGTVNELQRELASNHASLEPLFLELTSGHNGKASSLAANRSAGIVASHPQPHEK